MKKLLIAYLTILTLVLSAGVASAQIYKVKQGDTIGGIAELHEVTVDELMKHNDFNTPLIFPGDKLDIPNRELGGTRQHTVISGDTLWAIANQYGTTVSTLKSSNGLTSDFLYIGQKLTVYTSESNSYLTHTVVRGDNLWAIGSKYGTTIATIKQANGLTSDTIYPGQTLKILTKNNSTPVPPTSNLRANLTQGQIDLLARVVMAEAGGETYQGKVAVAAVIFNRITSPDFPNTLEGVLYQKWAFEAVENGSIWHSYPQPIIYEAVNDALKGSDPSYGALFFWNPYTVPGSNWVWTRPQIIQIGNHVFAK